jgi:mRNA interferase MazF
VVQTNRFNESKIKTVVAAIMTTSVRLAEAPGNVRCAPRDTGLRRESVVNVSQIVTVDKALFTARVGTVPMHVLSQVEEGLRLVLGL